MNCGCERATCPVKALKLWDARLRCPESLLCIGANNDAALASETGDDSHELPFLRVLWELRLGRYPSAYSVTSLMRPGLSILGI